MRAGLLPIVLAPPCVSPLILVEGDEVESGPLAVWLVVECGFREEARRVCVCALGVEALRVCSWRIFVIDPCALVGGLVRMVGPVAPDARERDGGAVRERNVVAFCVRGRLRVVSWRSADRKIFRVFLTGPRRSARTMVRCGSCCYIPFCFWLPFCVSSTLAVVALP